MARRSRADMEAQRASEIEKNKSGLVFSTAIYVRLSIENSKQSDEKDVIATQIECCKAYISEQTDLQLVEVFGDNGATGTNFKRRGFQQLMLGIEEGKINCVVVRDFSRLGRNRVECFQYISEEFPLMGVRFIAINDGYDSLTSDDSSLEVLLKNMMNEFYSHDISRKTSTALKTQMENGTFRKRNLPYGYMWGENRVDIIVDDAVSDFVKLIFKWKLEGVSSFDTAKRLDVLNAPLPDLRKYQNGVYRVLESSREYWSKTTVDGILKNPHYTGDLVLGRSEMALYKGIKPHSVKDENRWYVYPDNHPALVDREDFDTIQRKSKEITEKRKQLYAETEAERSKLVDLFVGKIFCADCGRRMAFVKAKLSKKWSASYKCTTALRSLQPLCSTHHLKQENLNILILDAIKTQVKVAVQYEKLLNMLKDSSKDKSIREKQNAQISSLRLKLNGLKQRSSRLYNDYAEGIINEEEYLFAKEFYHGDLESYRLQLENAIEQKRQFIEAMSSDNKWIKLMKSISKTKKLNQDLVDVAIEKVLVHEDKTVELIMKYHDVFIDMTSGIIEIEKGV